MSRKIRRDSLRSAATVSQVRAARRAVPARREEGGRREEPRALLDDGAPPRSPSFPTSLAAGLADGLSDRPSPLPGPQVGTRFKEQLGSLMSAIQATHVHYVRCVKPNPKSVSAEFDNALVAEQLRCAGALDAPPPTAGAHAARQP